MAEPYIIRDALPSDAAAICAIYNPFVLDSTITFELEPITEQEMAGRIQNIQKRYPWIVMERNGEMLGYAYASEWKPRAAFLHTAESSLYMHADARGQGLGLVLYQDLLDRLKAMHMHLVIAAITWPNDPSIALHSKLGFTELGRMTQAGRKFDQWIDVSYWQMLLD